MIQFRPWERDQFCGPPYKLLILKQYPYICNCCMKTAWRQLILRLYAGKCKRDFQTFDTMYKFGSSYGVFFKIKSAIGVTQVIFNL